MGSREPHARGRHGHRHGRAPRPSPSHAHPAARRPPVPIEPPSAGRVHATPRIAPFPLSETIAVIEQEVRRFRAFRLEHRDLRQAGVVGALEAWRRYDPTLGAPFSAYARPWIRKEVQRAIGSGEMALAIPPDAPAKAIAFRGLVEAGYPDHLAAAEVDLTLATAHALHAVLDTTSLDAIAGIEGSRVEPPASEPSVEDHVIEQTEHDAVRAVVSTLPEPQRTLVRLRFGFDGTQGRSLRQVARLAGLSDFTVRHHLRRATASMRRRLERHVGPCAGTGPADK